MSWRRITLLIAGGTLALAAAAVSWLLSADLGFVKPRIENLVTEATGRRFSIDGDLDILLGSESLVIANGIRFANADWAAEPDMLSVGRLELRVDTWSLLRGPIRVHEFAIDDVSVVVSVTEAGASNWTLGVEPADEDADGGLPGFLVERIDASNLRVVYTSPDRNGPLDLRVARLTQRLDDETFLDLGIDATLGGRELSVQATAGTWRDLIDQRDVEFDLDARIDTLTVSANGFIDDLRSPHRPAFEFAIDGPELNDLARLLRIDEDFVGNVDLSGSLSAVGDAPITLDLRGNLGQLQVEARGSFSDLQSFEQSSLTFSASGPDLARVSRLLGAPPIPSSPYVIRLEAERRGPLLEVRNAHIEYADAQFDLSARVPAFPTVDDATVRLSIGGQQFEQFREIMGMPGAASGPYSLTLDIDDPGSGAETLSLALQSALGELTANGTLGDAPGYIGSEFSFDAGTANLAAIGEAYGIDFLPERAATLDGQVEIAAEGIRTRRPITLNSGEVGVTVDGLISLSPTLAGSAFTVSGSAPDLAAAARKLAGVDGLPALPFRLDGRAEITAREFRLSGSRASIGSTDMEFDAALSRQPGSDASSLTLHAEGPALQELTEALSLPGVREGPFELSATATLTAQLLTLSDVDFVRPRGRISGNVDIELPFSERNAKFDIRGSGDDFASVAGQLGAYQPGNVPFRLVVRGNSRNRLLTLDRLNAELGRAKANVSGTIDFEAITGDTRLAVDVRIPDLAELGGYGGRAFNSQAFALGARLNVNSRTRTLRVEDLLATIGQSDVRGSVELRDGNVPEIDIRIRSDSLRYSPLLERPEIEYDPAPEFDDGRLIPDFTIPFDQLRRINAAVDIDVGELRREMLDLRSLRIVSTLRDGELELSRFGFQAPKGWLEAKGRLRAIDGMGQTELAVTARDLSMAFPNLNTDLSASARLDVHLASSGNDLQSLAGNASGAVFGRVDKLTHAEIPFLRRLYGDMLNEIVSAVNPFVKESRERQLDCMVAPLDIVDGRIVTKPNILIRTQMLRITSEASVNLKNEKIDFSFKTTPRRGITISAGELLNPYVKVVGTLTHPRLAVDQQGVLLSGGAAVATGGLSVLAQAAWRRLNLDANPCQTIEDMGLKALGDRIVPLSPPDAN